MRQFSIPSNHRAAYPPGGERVQEWLSRATRVTVLTGAGISEESGVPVFRGSQGLWRQYRPEELATPQAFARDPRLVWEWYNWRRSLVAKAEPNPAHRALVEMEQQGSEFVLITQNVDGLHERAGSRRLLKLHGDLWTLRCTSCEREILNHEVPLAELPPCCQCGSWQRPGVVWFGEALPGEVLRQAFEAAARAELFFAIGTSAVVEPAASLPRIAKQAGARVVEINLEETPLSPLADVSLHAKAGEILPQLLLPGAPKEKKETSVRR